MRYWRRSLIAAGLLWAGPALAQAPALNQAPVPAPLPGAVTAMMAQPCTPERTQVTDWPSLCRYQRANHFVMRAPRAVLIGDSITDFWLNIAPGLFATGVVDRGISGQTCAQIEARFYQDVVRLHPRVVHIMCGTNDVAGNAGPTSPEEFSNAILAMVDIARANNIAVVIGTILPAGTFSWRPGYRPAAQIVALNAWLAELAQERGLVIADYHTAMADPDGAMKPGLSSDGVHPTAAGYAVMEPITRAALDQAERTPH
jgi:lysophospholipase L1-like esterase